jgi:hypothetical protein
MKKDKYDIRTTSSMIFYGVVWTIEDSLPGKGEFLVISPVLTPLTRKTIKNKLGIGIDSLAIFRKKVDALNFKKDIPDCKVIPIRIMLSNTNPIEWISNTSNDLIKKRKKNGAKNS